MSSEHAVPSLPTADRRDSFILEPSVGLIDPHTGELIVPLSNPGGFLIPKARGQLHGKHFELAAIHQAFGVPLDWRAHPQAPMDLPAELSATGLPVSFKAKGGDYLSMGQLDSGDAVRGLDWPSHTLAIAFWTQVSRCHKRFDFVLEIDVDMNATDESGVNIVLGQFASHRQDIVTIKELINSSKGLPRDRVERISERSKEMVAGLGDPLGALTLRSRVGSRERRLQFALDPFKLLEAGFASRRYQSAYRGLELPFFVRSGERETRLTKAR